MTLFAMLCLIASIVIYITYIGYIYIKYRPDCISKSYYLLNNKELFTIWILLVSFLIFPAWVEISPINFQFLPFLTIIALSSVGINPKYLESERAVHIISAIIAVLISLVWNIVTGIYLIPIIFSVILLILYIFKVNNFLFWIECSAFSNIYLSIIFS